MAIADIVATFQAKACAPSDGRSARGEASSPSHMSPRPPSAPLHRGRVDCLPPALSVIALHRRAIGLIGPYLRKVPLHLRGERQEAAK
eukprot:12894975-Prorocentrum_lima.AAC.1